MLHTVANQSVHDGITITFSLCAISLKVCSNKMYVSSSKSDEFFAIHMHKLLQKCEYENICVHSYINNCTLTSDP